jgi:hypothetical protein
MSNESMNKLGFYAAKVSPGLKFGGQLLGLGAFDGNGAF